MRINGRTILALAVSVALISASFPTSFAFHPVSFSISLYTRHIQSLAFSLVPVSLPVVILLHSPVPLSVATQLPVTLPVPLIATRHTRADIDGIQATRLAANDSEARRWWDVG